MGKVGCTFGYDATSISVIEVLLGNYKFPEDMYQPTHELFEAMVDFRQLSQKTLWTQNYAGKAGKIDGMTLTKGLPPHH